MRVPPRSHVAPRGSLHGFVACHAGTSSGLGRHARRRPGTGGRCARRRFAGEGGRAGTCRARTCRGRSQAVRRGRKARGRRCGKAPTARQAAHTSPLPAAPGGHRRAGEGIPAQRSNIQRSLRNGTIPPDQEQAFRQYYYGYASRGGLMSTASTRWRATGASCGTN